MAVSAVSSNTSLLRRFASWISRFRVPSMFKAFVVFYTALLWFGVVPLLVGFAYEMLFIKSTE